MKRSDRLPMREAWLLCFLLGVVMLNYPFLHIFNKPLLVFGIPLPYLYFLVGWPTSILVIVFFVRHSEREDAGNDEREDDT